MKLTPLQKRNARRERNKSPLDLNLVSLIDVFTILIFFLLSNSAEVEILPSTKAVQLPESSADKHPRETLVVVVSGEEILVQGRKVASVPEVLAATGDLIESLKAELDLQQATRQSVRAKAEGKEDPLSKAVTIMGDKDIPYRLLRRVMLTCARANFTDVAFAVRPQGGLVSTAIGAISFRTTVLPWTVAADDDRRFKRILWRVLVVSLLLALLMPWVPPPTVDRKQVQELPPGFAQLILEREPVKPPPPPPPPKPDAEAEAAAKPDAPKPETAKPEPKQKPVPEARQPKPNKPPGEDLASARRKASGVGLMAMANELADLRSAPVAVQLKPDIKQGPGVGTGVGVGVGAGTDAGTPLRSLITSNATGGSGGINTAGYSRNTGGGGLAGRSTTLVEGVAGGGGGGGAGGGGGSAKGGKGAGGSLQRGASGKASRSIEEIRLVFERNKGAIYAIYNRALREDPTLQGKVVLELKIAPSGEVLDCRVVSSELKETELERKLVGRIKQFDFGAKDVDQMIVTYPVDFLPS